jgi:hypothetical protein
VTWASWAAVRPLAERALVITEAAYALDHPGIAAVRNNLTQLIGEIGLKQSSKGPARPSLTLAAADCTPEGSSAEHVTGLRRSGRMRAGRDDAGRWVQQESTATGPDGGGQKRTFQDDDLRRWTVMDVLPADGMQEVWGSNPHSSPLQKHNSNGSNAAYSSKVQQRRPVGSRTSVLVRSAREEGLGPNWARHETVGPLTG